MSMDIKLVELKKEFAEEIKQLAEKTQLAFERQATWNRAAREEIIALKEENATLRAKKTIATIRERISPSDWERGLAALKACHPGKTFFKPEDVRAAATESIATARVDEYDFEYDEH